MIKDDGGKYLSNPISFTVKGLSGSKPFWTEMNLTMDAVKNKIFIKDKKSTPFYNYKEQNEDRPFFLSDNYFTKLTKLKEMIERVADL